MQLSRRLLRHLLFAIAVFVPSVQSFATDKLPVVATFSILADMVSSIGGERVAVTALVGPDQDAHVFEPRPSDVRSVARAKLVVTNGLGFEGWITRLVESSGYQGELVVVTDGVAARTMASDEHGAHAAHGEGGGEGEHHGDAEGMTDPHAWQNPENAVIYAKEIIAALSKVDPAGAPSYRERGARYIQSLTELDAWAKAAFHKIPAGKRRVITSHDAFGYFGAHYGIEFLAPQGVSTEGDVNARDVAELILQIRRERIKAVFIENMSNSRVLEQLGRETGVKPTGELYADALSGRDGPAPTYLRMMRHNVEQLLVGLKQN